MLSAVAIAKHATFGCGLRAYVRYERALAVPTVDELDRLLRVVAPGRALVLQQGAA